MRRFVGLIGLALYTLALLLASIATAHAAAAATGSSSLAVWFWTEIDWASFGTAAFIALVAGAVRTGMTLRNGQPTFRVLLEGIGDAVISFFSGGFVFMLLMIWQSYRGPVNQWVMFGCIFSAGLLRGGFITWVEDSIKRLLGTVTDQMVGWVVAKGAALAAKQAEPPKDPL